MDYATFPNHLTNDPNDFMAIPQNVKSYTMADILKEMVTPGGVTSTQAAAVLDAFTVTQKKILEAGGAINTELYNIYPSISGVFENDEDVFDPARHSVKFNMNLGTNLKDIASRVRVEKIMAVSPVPVVKSFTDSATRRKNEIITAGKVGELKGLNLKLDESDPTQGVFFITGGQEYRVENYIRNKPGDLLFFIPANLPVGSECKVEVRSIFEKEKQLKTGMLLPSLSVVA